VANIPPPNLCQKSAMDKMFSEIDSHQNWPVHADVFNHPPPRLSPRHPIWSYLAHVDMNTQWKEDWQSASVTSHAIVVDPITRQPGFDLPRCPWSLFNHFRTGQGPCKASLYKWGLTQSSNCSCGEPQTMNHIVETANQAQKWTDNSTRC